MQLQTLGTLRLKGTSFGQPKPLTLLSYLSLEGAKSKGHLAELFWPQGNRMKSLSMTLTRLKQGVGNIIEADTSKVWLTLSSDAKDLLESLDKSDWQKASEQYSGAFLEGILLDDWNAELEEWVYSTREYLAERVQYALLNLAGAAASQQDFDQAGLLAERAYKLPGLSGHEPATLNRLYPLLCAGKSLFAPIVRKEAEGYGLILSLTTSEAKSLFVSPKSESSSPTLPVRNTAFVGRQKELGELSTLLGKPGKLLLSLVGAGGTGKTRLALELAQQPTLAEFFTEGIFFISLESLKDSKLIPTTLLSHFGLQSSQHPTEQVIDFLKERKSLVILDNFEHLAEASVLLSELLAKCSQVKLLVTSRERLRLEEEHIFSLEGLTYPHILSTRAGESEAVQLFKERAQQLQPHFSLVDNLTDVLKICQLVAGLPLGIELAASWIRLMTCSEIATEIEVNLEFLSSTSRNIPDRHKSLRAVFEYSWQLLSGKEQEVLRKLAVFRGGFRREAAAEIAGANIPILASLVDKSLLRVLSNGRYDRHPLLYQFTQDKLAELSEQKKLLQTHHAHFYLELAQTLEPLLRGKQQVFAFSRLEEELDNLREALGYLKQSDSSSGLMLGTALGFFWQTKGLQEEGFKYLMSFFGMLPSQNLLLIKAKLQAAHLCWEDDYQQGKSLYEEVFENAQGVQNLDLQVGALLGLGRIAQLNESDFERASLHYKKALELAEKSTNRQNLAHALHLLGTFYVEQADYNHAQTYYEAAINLYNDLDDALSRAKSASSLATVLNYLGKTQEAHRLNLESLALFKQVGDRYGEGITLLNLGMDAYELDEQNLFYEQSLELFRASGNKRMISHLLNNLANNHRKMAMPQKALAMLEESLRLQEIIGDVSLISHALLIKGQVFHDLKELDKALTCLHSCLERCRQTGDNWTLMRGLEAIAKLYADTGASEDAFTAINEAIELAEQSGDQGLLERALKTRHSLFGV